MRGRAATPGRAFIFIVYIIMFFLTLFLIADAVRLRELLRADTWPVADGLVTESGMTANDSGKHVSFCPFVHYAYSVGSQNYSGDEVISRVGVCSEKESAQGLIDRFPVGAKIRIHIDPEDPEKSVLVAISDIWVEWLMLAIYVVFLASMGSVIFIKHRDRL